MTKQEIVRKIEEPLQLVLVGLRATGAGTTQMHETRKAFWLGVAACLVAVADMADKIPEDDATAVLDKVMDHARSVATEGRSDG